MPPELLLFLILVILLLGTLLIQWPISLLSLLAGLFLWFRNPKADVKNVSKFFHGFRIGGHRGSSIKCPENTMTSFKQAELDGADLIEFDIGLTKDGIAVIMHDDTLDRTTNMSGAIRDYFFDELAANCNCAHKFIMPLHAHAGNRRAPTDGEPFSQGHTSTTFERAPILTMEELVKWAKSRGMKMIFDVKDTDKELAEQIQKLFEDHDLFDSAIVCSFFPSIVYRIKRHNKHIMTGLTWRRWFVSYIDLDWKNPRNKSPIWHHLAMVLDVLWMLSIKLWLPLFLGVDMVLTERGEISENYVKFMRARGLQICAWTVNDEREMAWMVHKLEIPFLTDVPHLAYPIIMEYDRKIIN